MIAKLLFRAGMAAMLLAGAAPVPGRAHPTAGQASVPSDAALAAAVAGTWRSPQNRARDAYRHPLESLTFWGLKPGATVVEIEPGAHGWWTEILGPYLKATGGTYVAALPDRNDSSLSDGAKAERVKAAAAFWDGVADHNLYAKVEAYDFGPQHTDTIPAQSADLVLVARAFHNWAQSGDQTDTYLKAFYLVLKPGGILAVEQHRAPERSDPEAGTGYVPESYVIAAAQRAGFVLDGRSEINANPKDTKDYPFGVWTLPPTRRSSAFGQPADPAFDHSLYDAIGESDRMTLRFRKPG